MKLVLAIVQDQFVHRITKALLENQIRSTKLSSSGGFLNAGNTTLLIGSEDEDIDKLIETIKGECKTTKINKNGEEITIGGANLFILDMDQYLKI